MPTCRCWNHLPLLVLISLMTSVIRAELPAAFDLRDVNGDSFVSKVKAQKGGTCWTFGTMASIESNLMLSGVWSQSGQSGEANLAEYHLDWWNGFNRHHNADDSSTGGLTVHQGGDYRVAAAYLTRGTGVVRDSDAPSYSSPPKQKDSSYRYYYVRDIEWLSAGSNLERLDQIKKAIVGNGVIGTALAWSSSFFSSSAGTFYQPPSSSSKPNHAVAIVGWDDNKATRAPQNGAWLIKNSWGSSWGKQGYFWGSYYDKVIGKHSEMGAVVFKNSESMRYDKIYSHDYHGWRDTKANISEAFNAFNNDSGQTQVINAIGLYTATENVEVTIKVFRKFESGQLKELVSIEEQLFTYRGYHTVDLGWPVTVASGQSFYVFVHLDRGGHPFDKTSDVPLLLCGSHNRVIVKSKAAAGQSYFMREGQWVDFTTTESTGNFTIKALANDS